VDNLGKEIAYRKAIPSEVDKDTSIVTPDKTTILHPKSKQSIAVLFCSIAKHIDTRSVNKYDRAVDEISREYISTDEYAIGDLILIPSAQLLAAADKSNPEDLNARSTIGRFISIVRVLTKYDIQIEPATSPGYLQSALKNWKLEEFSFTARPFNPSVRTPGDKLHPLLAGDNAKLVGKEKPNKGEHLIYSEQGLMNEVTGLADRGYGEYGAVGTTSQGYHARIEKADPTGNRQPKIKVYIPPKSSKEEHVKAVATSLLEIDGQ
ncbi:MAG: hypothetical protein AB1478_12260, partial [Nitrospirota bacterium]